ncbi:MAG: conserved phage C-terminus family protein [Herbinix sp.]|jgi:predicted phage replisome organizer|nr:conserved phage C-terminus family protein [Herbinix sp.]
MADVKWIKFYVSILTSPKIKRIRRMPDGNTIALIWAFLLAQAGESNKEGALYFTDEIPYTPEEFAMQYDFEVDTVRLAVATFEKFGMIEVFDGIIYIKNWEEYQNTGGLEKMREQNRIRQARFKQKLLSVKQNNVTVTLPVTQGNATDIDIDIDKDKDKDIKRSNSRFTPPTPEEIKAYCKERNNQVDAERFYDFYSSKGWMVGRNKMKDWKACVRTWEKVSKTNPHDKPEDKPKSTNKFNQYPQRTYTAQDYAEIERKLLNKGL